MPTGCGQSAVHMLAGEQEHGMLFGITISVQFEALVYCKGVRLCVFKYIFPWSASLGPLPYGRVAVRGQAFPLFDRSLDDGVVRALWMAGGRVGASGTHLIITGIMHVHVESLELAPAPQLHES